MIQGRASASNWIVVFAPLSAFSPTTWPSPTPTPRRPSVGSIPLTDCFLCLLVKVLWNLFSSFCLKSLLSMVGASWSYHLGPLVVGQLLGFYGSRESWRAPQSPSEQNCCPLGNCSSVLPPMVSALKRIVQNQLCILHLFLQNG